MNLGVINRDHAADAFAAEVIKNDDEGFPFAHSHDRIVVLARAYMAAVDELDAYKEFAEAAFLVRDVDRRGFGIGWKTFDRLRDSLARFGSGGTHE